MQGKLYVVSTPIGNLGDFSKRGAETLASVDFIAAEDTRVSARLLGVFGIKKPQVSYYEHNRREKGRQIAQRIMAGENCAVITDAGTPAISDPGGDLVAICLDAGVEVVSVPGPSAVIAALSISGLPCGRFTFEGFLSTASKKRREHLAQIKDEPRTMVFYEAPHKLLYTLRDLEAALGDRTCAVCREITKLHEQVIRTTLRGALDYFEQTAPKGEFVLVIGGAPSPQAEGDDALEKALAYVEKQVSLGKSLKDGVREAAEIFGVKRNSLYKSALEIVGEAK